ncbi:pentapeptide repeat-containing protein [Rhodococcus qingshengii]|uniref:pentapeptide repeat-containing protein n=1 Tax=Rhodococcus qingshengii TaxID=334542 RepID=UPI0036033D20
MRSEGSPVDEPAVPSSSSGSSGTQFGFLAGSALVAVSVALFIVSGFAILSGESGVAQPVATVLGGAGVFSAGVLTFRSAHNTRISAERTAAAALAHSRTELEHARTVATEEKVRHERQFEDQRQQAERARTEQAKTFERTYQREVIRDLRSRYTVCAEQLANPSAAIRLAGVYALASLADDWQQQDERDEKQVAIDLLCAYLRTPNTYTPSLSAARLPDTGELEVRQTILLTLQKRSVLESSDPKNWKGFDYKFINADLIGANLTNADLAEARLTGANLTGANLTGAKLNSARLISMNLTGASLMLAKLTGADLTWADLTGANLTVADLTGATLTGAKLSDAKLNSAKLNSANLTGADLKGAKLSDAKLNSAKLNSANLTGANLKGADLTGGNLTGANLTGANLKGANLSGVNLTDANLSSVDLSEATYVNMYYTPGTIWPEGIDQPATRERP